MAEPSAGGWQRVEQLHEAVREAERGRAVLQQTPDEDRLADFRWYLQLQALGRLGRLRKGWGSAPDSPDQPRLTAEGEG